LHLAVQLLTERLHHAGAKLCRAGGSTAGPSLSVQTRRSLRLESSIVHAISTRQGRSAKFGGVRAQLVESHRKRNDRA